MQEWKQYVIQEVAQELQAIRFAQDEVMEAQRQSFQTKLERMREKLQQVELKSKTLENKIKTLKANEKAPEYSPAPSIPTVKDAQAMPSSSKVINGGKTVKPPPKNYAQIAAANAAQKLLEKAWTEVTSSNRKQKGTSSNVPKVEPEKRGVIFWKEVIFSHRSEADLMLVLNELLQRAGIPAYTRFSKMRYSQSGAISRLLIEKSNTENLIKDHSNALI